MNIENFIRIRCLYFKSNANVYQKFIFKAINLEIFPFLVAWGAKLRMLKKYNNKSNYVWYLYFRSLTLRKIISKFDITFDKYFFPINSWGNIKKKKILISDFHMLDQANQFWWLKFFTWTNFIKQNSKYTTVNLYLNWICCNRHLWTSN